MALRFPRISQGLAQDPTTRRIWFGIATAHDFESHDDITEKRLYQNIFASHFGQLAIIFLWTSGNLFHVAWQENFETWVQDPLHVRPIAHAIWDPYFGQLAVEAFARGGALGPVNIAYSGVYQWWYTINLRTNGDLYTGALFLLFLSAKRGGYTYNRNGNRAFLGLKMLNPILIIICQDYSESVPWLGQDI
ncbi:photosystem I P700 chlorophyll a apoprotein A2-like [Arachis stenosperma]|uniref:photosystem I P700 chlorophyll a apoprotein A2-like n=1 Tax=Arachis stenosperma TaxID=217475 RepID=UPI0025ABCDA2|nr:photosystem I P700 chlorophyll a apoprotein A2-like [Arachis stenosperma]